MSAPVAGGVLLRVRVVPGSSRSMAAGEIGDRLKVRVTAPPEDGAANEAVREVIAKELGAKTSQVLLVSGHAVRDKVFRLEPALAARAGELWPWAVVTGP